MSTKLRLIYVYIYDSLLTVVMNRLDVEREVVYQTSL